MSKFLVACGFVAVIAAVVLCAGDITVMEYTDKECKGGSKVVHKVEQGSCNKDHFGHGSFEATCAAAPAGCMEIYHAIFTKNASHPCSDFNVKMLAPAQCGKCTMDHMGRGMKIDCPASGSNVTLHAMCDDKCATCKHTVSIKEKTCNSFPHIDFDVGVSAPEKCHSVISVKNYKADNCEGDAMMQEDFADSCYGFGGRDGKGGGRSFHCSN